MSSENSKAEARQKKTPTNSRLKSSLVHKPFATGTINIFNPHRKRKESESLSAPKLFLNAQLEQDLDKRKAELDLSELDLNLEPDEIEYQEQSWLDSLLNPWGISAIAILFTINLIAAGFIWRNTKNAENIEQKESRATIGHQQLQNKEFMPLNLSTLSMIDAHHEETEESNSDLAPLAPALVPLNDIANLSSFNTEYHYILTEYVDEQSLTLAREKVKQVSLVNFPQGMVIYLGAFKNRADANQFVAQLKQDNFGAYVYPLD